MRRLVPLGCLLILTLSVAALAGCGKSLAPTAPASTDRSALASAAVKDWLPRLRFEGMVLGDRSATYYASPPASDATQIDTLPAWSVLRQIQWRRPQGDVETLPFPGAPLQVGDTLPPGGRVVTVQRPERAGGGTVTFRVWSGFPPDTWWAGPDPSRWPRSSDGDGRAVDVTDWTTFSTVPAWPPDGRGYFGPDSFRYRPSLRLPPGGDFTRATFYEIWGNRIYARSEGDTVHQGAWLVVCNGGRDWDSPYRPLVDATDPMLPPGYGSDPAYALLQPAGRIGSPIGFRMTGSARPLGQPGEIIRFPNSSTFPAFLPLSVFRSPHVMGYWPATPVGKLYLLARAVDADGQVDVSVVDPAAVADAVDGGWGTPLERALRRKILTLYVRPAPPRGPIAMSER